MTDKMITVYELRITPADPTEIPSVVSSFATEAEATRYADAILESMDTAEARETLFEIGPKTRPMTAHEETCSYLEDFAATGRLDYLDGLSVDELARADRPTLLAYANRKSLPTFECLSARELLDMDIDDLRFEITVVDLDILRDRLADARNSAF